MRAFLSKLGFMIVSLAISFVLVSIVCYCGFLILVFGFFYNWIYLLVYGSILGIVTYRIYRWLSKPNAFEVDLTGVRL